jgi:hypothetical protein
MTAPLAAEPLAAAVARMDAAPAGLLALGIPRCPACQLLPATLGALLAARPGLPVALALLATPEDWADRERLLWPRGVRVSRASVPVLVLMRGGRAAATRPGSAPAHVLDAWLAGHLGPADRPLDPELTPAEHAALAATAPRRAQHHVVRTRDDR